MRKLFTLLALAGTLFAAGCDDGKEKEGDPSVVTLDPDISKDQKILASDTEVTIRFSTTGDWKAGMIETTPAATRMSLAKPLPAIEWAEIDGVSGNKAETSGTDGNHAITINFKPNTATTPRAVKLMIAGDSPSQESIVITQLGTGQTTEPETKQVKSIATTHTTIIDKGIPEVVKGSIVFDYDSEGRMTSCTLEDDDNDKIGYAMSYGDKKITITLPFLPNDTDTTGEYTVTLNAAGYATKIATPKLSDDGELEFTYTDGFLTGNTYPDQSYSDYNFKWTMGNMVKSWSGDTEPEDGEYGADHFDYSPHLNNTTNLDLNMLFIAPSYYVNYDWDSGLTIALGLQDHLGERSAKLTTSYFIDMVDYGGTPGQEFYYKNEETLNPLVYEKDNNGYISKITKNYTVEKYKVKNDATKQKTLEETTVYTDVYEITYAE